MVISMFFTKEEFEDKYPDMAFTPENWQIEAVSQMILSQIGLTRRDESWTSSTVPQPIKNACLEQTRFMFEHDIPFVDTSKLKAGSMDAELHTDYSTLALRYLANADYLYRGSPMMSNRGINMPFGD